MLVFVDDELLTVTSVSCYIVHVSIKYVEVYCHIRFAHMLQLQQFFALRAALWDRPEYCSLKTAFVVNQTA